MQFMFGLMNQPTKKIVNLFQLRIIESHPSMAFSIIINHMNPITPEKVKQRLVDQEQRSVLIIFVLTTVSLIIFFILIVFTLNLTSF
jgi:CHASE3 domain sensor protein